MSTLAEIEEAVVALPAPQQEELLSFITQRLRRQSPSPAQADDPVQSIIGAFAGRHDATGRKSEEILYGLKE